MKQGHWFQEWKVELPQMLVYFITNAGKNQVYRCGYQWDLWGPNGPRKRAAVRRGACALCILPDRIFSSPPGNPPKTYNI